MIESIFQTFLLLGTFDIILISVSIANYAVSASYLGRETRLTRFRMEKRKQKLERRIRELQLEGLSIGDLKKETKEAEDDINALRNRIFFLSWLGAVIFPSASFIISLIFAVVGLNSDFLLLDSRVLGLMITSVFFLGLGFFLLILVIGVIDSAAKEIPIPVFDVSFGEEETKIIILKRKEKKIVRVNVGNIGEDIAEDIRVALIFPNDFKIDPGGSYTLQPAYSKSYPNCMEVWFKRDLLHASTYCATLISLTAPNLKKSYEIQVKIDERKIGPSDHKLTIEVTD